MNPPPPWRPMSEAPRDGTDIVAIYSDLSGTAVIFWGECVAPPHEAGWFNYTLDVGDIENSDYWGPEDDEWYGWVPYVTKE